MESIKNFGSKTLSTVSSYWNKFTSWVTNNPKKAAVIIAVGASVLAIQLASAQERNFHSPSDTVVALASKNKGIFCSAVSVGDGMFLTANHCLDKQAYVMLEKKDEKGKTILETWAPFKTIKTRPQSDQAVIQTDDPSITIPKAAICKDGAQEGFDLMAIGFPLGEVKTRTYGEFISLDYLDKKLQDSSISDPFYRTTVPIIGGNSGGGLFMEEDGSFCLTGLATAVMPVHYPMSWFSNLDGIKELLKDG